MQYTHNPYNVFLHQESKKDWAIALGMSVQCLCTSCSFTKLIYINNTQKTIPSDPGDRL